MSLLWYSLGARTLRYSYGASFAEKSHAVVWSEQSLVLILGTKPSPKSREARFFYMHPQNRFWKPLVFNETLNFANVPPQNDDCRAAQFSSVRFFTTQIKHVFRRYFSSQFLHSSTSVLDMIWNVIFRIISRTHFIIKPDNTR